MTILPRSLKSASAAPAAQSRAAGNAHIRTPRRKPRTSTLLTVAISRIDYPTLEPERRRGCSGIPCAWVAAARAAVHVSTVPIGPMPMRFHIRPCADRVQALRFAAPSAKVDLWVSDRRTQRREEANHEQGYGQEEGSEEKAGQVSAGEARREEGEETEPGISGLKELRARARDAQRVDVRI